MLLQLSDPFCMQLHLRQTFVTECDVFLHEVITNLLVFMHSWYVHIHYRVRFMKMDEKLYMKPFELFSFKHA